MSGEEEDRRKQLLAQAAGIVAASEGKVGITKAMELVGYSEEERKTMKFYQQVRRRSHVLVVVEKKSVVPLESVQVNPSTEEISGLTTNSTNR